MLNSHKTKDDNISRKSENLEQKIFSFAKDAGLEKWIEFDTEMGNTFLLPSCKMNYTNLLTYII
jgi:hypothetical protein